MVEMINRPQTNEEKKDFSDISRRRKDSLSVFRATCASKEQEVRKKYLPFCARCALLNFQDKLNSVKLEMQRIGKDVDINNPNVKVDLNLDDYVGQKKFKFEAKEEVREDKLIDGMRTNVIVGYDLKYKCKDRFCGCCVFIPKDIYEERINNKKDEEKPPTQ